MQWLRPAGQRDDVDGVAQVVHFLAAGNAIVAGADQLLVDRLALGKELQPSDVVGALGKFGELIVAANLGGGELVEVHGDQVRVVGHG